MKYRLIEENKLRRLIEGNMIYDELCAQGVDDWISYDFIHYPDIDDIETELNKYDKFEEREEYSLYFGDKFTRELTDIIHNDIFNTPSPCATCSNHPSNGGSGICNCVLGLPKVTC